MTSKTNQCYNIFLMEQKIYTGGIYGKIITEVFPVDLQNNF